MYDPKTDVLKVWLLACVLLRAGKNLGGRASRKKLGHKNKSGLYFSGTFLDSIPSPENKYIHAYILIQIIKEVYIIIL